MEKDIDGQQCWSTSSVDYVNAAIKTIEKGLVGRTWKLPSKATTPMTTSYLPELDGTAELEGYMILHCVRK